MSYVTDEWKELITQPVVRMFYLEGNTIQELIPGTEHTSLCGEAIRQFEEENDCMVIAASQMQPHVCFPYKKRFSIAFKPVTDLARVTMALRGCEIVLDYNELREQVIEGHIELGATKKRAIEVGDRVIHNTIGFDLGERLSNYRYWLAWLS